MNNVEKTGFFRTLLRGTWNMSLLNKVVLAIYLIHFGKIAMDGVSTLERMYFGQQESVYAALAAMVNDMVSADWVPIGVLLSVFYFFGSGVLLGGWAYSMYFGSQGWDWRERPEPDRHDPVLRIVPGMLLVASALIVCAMALIPHVLFLVAGGFMAVAFLRTVVRIIRFSGREAASGPRSPGHEIGRAAESVG